MKAFIKDRLLRRSLFRNAGFFMGIEAYYRDKAVKRLFLV